MGGVYKINFFTFFILNIFQARFFIDFDLLGASKRVQKLVAWTVGPPQKSLKTIIHSSKITFSLKSLYHIQLNCKCWFCTPLPRKITIFAFSRKHNFCSKSLRRHMKWLCDLFFSVFTSLGPPKWSKNELRKLGKRIISRFWVPTCFQDPILEPKLTSKTPSRPYFAP